MPCPPASQNSALRRTTSWPPTTTHLLTNGPTTPKVTNLPSATSKPQQTYEGFDDIEDHPEDLFLTPMETYEYDDWADDSDDDGEEIEWDAGITDFTLFDSDRRRAQETRQELPSRWNGFISMQEQALRRSVQRSRDLPVPDTTKPPLPVEDVPGLTPDGSPDLRDDLDVESFHGQSQSRPSVPSYLRVTLTPPAEDDDEDEESVISDDELPIALLVDRARQRQKANRRLERPGLRHSRTLSGKAHVWRRPSWHIYPVGENPEAEAKAESENEELEETGRGRPQ